MFGSAAIDVALGLAFVYFVLSVICAQINEWVAAIFDLRAKDRAGHARAAHRRPAREGIRTVRPRDRGAEPPAAPRSLAQGREAPAS